MPYKSDSIPFLQGTVFDRRVKLSEKQREDLTSLRGSMPQREAAKIFGVSRSLVRFIWYPEKLEENRRALKKRGGWRCYYNKEKNTRYMREHRQYKHALFSELKRMKGVR